VLRRLKVVAQHGRDEFDTLGLARYRSTRQWYQVVNYKEYLLNGIFDDISVVQLYEIAPSALI